MPLPELASWAAESGFGMLEVACWPAGKAERRYGGVTHIDVEGRADTKKIMARTAAGDLFAGLLPEHPRRRGGDRASLVDHLKKVIDAAALLEVPIVGTFVGADQDRNMRPRIWKKFARVWPPIVKYAGERGHQDRYRELPVGQVPAPARSRGESRLGASSWPPCTRPATTTRSVVAARGPRTSKPATRRSRPASASPTMRWPRTSREAAMQTLAELITALPDDLPGTIRAVKRQLRSQLGDPRAALEIAAAALREEVATVVAEIADIGSAVPVVEYSDVAAGTVPAERVAAIRRRGCAVVHGTFERSQAEAWDDELEAYLDGNDFMGRYRGPADELFSALSSGRPQIYGVYWSRPQIAARRTSGWSPCAVSSTPSGDTTPAGASGSTPTATSATPTRTRRRPRSSPDHTRLAQAACGQAGRALPGSQSSGGCCPPVPEQRRPATCFDGEWRSQTTPWDRRPHSQQHARVLPTTVMCSGVPHATFQGRTRPLGDASTRRRRAAPSRSAPIPPAIGLSLLACGRCARTTYRRRRACAVLSTIAGSSPPPSSHRRLCCAAPTVRSPAVEPGGRACWWRRRPAVPAAGGVGDELEPAPSSWGDVMYIPAAPSVRSSNACACAPIVCAARRFAGRGAQPQRRRRRGLRGRLRQPGRPRRPQRHRAPPARGQPIELVASRTRQSPMWAAETPGSGPPAAQNEIWTEGRPERTGPLVHLVP